MREREREKMAANLLQQWTPQKKVLGGNKISRKSNGWK
jgi:hypothetical protein